MHIIGCNHRKVSLLVPGKGLQKLLRGDDGGLHEGDCEGKKVRKTVRFKREGALGKEKSDILQSVTKAGGKKKRKKNVTAFKIKKKGKHRMG